MARSDVSSFKMGMNSEDSCNTTSYRAGKVTWEIVYILGWPIFTAVGCLLIHKFLSFNFWTEIVSLFTITGLIIYFVNRDGFKRDRDGGTTLRNILIILVGGSFAVLLSNTSNLELNNLNLTIKMVGACLIVASSVVSVLEIPNLSNYNNQRLGYDTYYPGFTALICLMVIILTAAEIWMHFGSQFIWVPVIVSTTCFYFINLRAREMSTKANKIGFNLIVMLLFLALGIISTLYQFWFSRIVWGIKLWHIISVLGGIIVIVAVYCIVDHFKTKKKKRLEMEEAGRKETEKKEQEYHAKLSLVKLAEQAINENNEPLWIEIFTVVEFHGMKISKFHDLVPKFAKAPLESLVTISDIKKQIVFNRDLKNALEIIELIANQYYADDILEAFIGQLSNFIKVLNKEYKGYDGVLMEIERSCPGLYDLYQRKK